MRHGELGAISAAWCAAFGGTAFAVRHSRRPRPLLAAAHLLPLTPRPCGRASGRQAPHQWVGAAEPILQTNPRQHPRFDPCCSETREVNSRTAAGCGCRSGSCLAEPRINSGEREGQLSGRYRNSLYTSVWNVQDLGGPAPDELLTFPGANRLDEASRSPTRFRRTHV